MSLNRFWETWVDLQKRLDETKAMPPEVGSWFVFSPIKDQPKTNLCILWYVNVQEVPIWCINITYKLMIFDKKTVWQLRVPVLSSNCGRGSRSTASWGSNVSVTSSSPSPSGWVMGTSSWNRWAVLKRSQEIAYATYGITYARCQRILMGILMGIPVFCWKHQLMLMSFRISRFSHLPCTFLWPPPFLPHEGEVIDFYGVAQVTLTKDE